MMAKKKHGKNFKCTACGRVLASKPGLINHWNSIHGKKYKGGVPHSKKFTLTDEARTYGVIGKHNKKAKRKKRFVEKYEPVIPITKPAEFQIQIKGDEMLVLSKQPLKITQAVW